MVIVEYTNNFKKSLKKHPDKTRLKKLIRKLVNNPLLGKPMRYQRKGLREVYLKPFRLSYSYFESSQKIILFEIYHKDSQ